MDRATTWRNRIDAPTNWAIISVGTTASFVLNDPVHSHVVLLLMMLMVCSFLTIEARRRAALAPPGAGGGRRLHPVPRPVRRRRHRAVTGRRV
jgi:hypothetical protein